MIRYCKYVNTSCVLCMRICCCACMHACMHALCCCCCCCCCSSSYPCHLPPEVFFIQQYIPSINTGTILLVRRRDRASAFDRDGNFGTICSRYLAMPSEVFLHTGILIAVLATNLCCCECTYVQCVLYTRWRCGCFCAVSVHLLF